MSHKPYLEWMQAALDGTLASEPRRQLDEHLAACEACQASWDVLMNVQRLFTRPPLARPRPGFSGRFKARLQERRSRPRLVWGALALGLGAFSAAALVLPLGVSVLVSGLRAAQQPATGAALLTGLNATTLFAGAVLEALAVTGRALAAWATGQPLIFVTAALGLLVVPVWLYSLRRLLPEGVTR